MLELCLLGTGGMLPLPYRALTSLMVRYNGSSILIDCGEGTQNQIRLQGWSFKPIDVICITHFHADHISGLPGMLLTMGNAERTEPLTMIGPKGLEHVVNSLRIIDAARARALGLPVQYWSLLQKGETVDYEGNVYTSDMVMGSPRKGLKVTYCTDTRPVDAIAECAKDADLFICEGMYGEEEKLSKAKEHKHMMMREAAELAKEAQVHEMWLTHYSPATNRPKEFEAMVQSIFPQGYIAKDRTEKVLNFEED